MLYNLDACPRDCRRDAPARTPGTPTAIAAGRRRQGVYSYWRPFAAKNFSNVSPLPHAPDSDGDGRFPGVEEVSTGSACVRSRRPLRPFVARVGSPASRSCSRRHSASFVEAFDKLLFSYYTYFYMFKTILLPVAFITQRGRTAGSVPRARPTIEGKHRVRDATSPVGLDENVHRCVLHRCFKCSIENAVRQWNWWIFQPETHGFYRGVTQVSLSYSTGPAE